MKTKHKTAMFIGAAIATAVMILSPSSWADSTIRRATPAVKVYIDPVTGELLSAPPKGAEDIVTPRVILPEPEQVESPVPGGGIMGETDGRFQTPLRAYIGKDGTPMITHDSKEGESQ